MDACTLAHKNVQENCSMLRIMPKTQKHKQEMRKKKFTRYIWHEYDVSFTNLIIVILFMFNLVIFIRQMYL